MLVRSQGLSESASGDIITGGDFLSQSSLQRKDGRGGTGQIRSDICLEGWRGFEISRRLIGGGTVRNVIVWGAPSGTQLPDIEHASVTCDSRPAGLHQALRGADRLAFQQQRETAVWTGCTMSVASAICDHLRALWSGTPE
ncbi:hypothetical protein chiPu_0022788, partial [Chiloscyllium punctatum]|nr:hypothetical protein [Chiloscyllium punctatum]